MVAVEILRSVVDSVEAAKPKEQLATVGTGGVASKEEGFSALLNWPSAQMAAAGILAMIGALTVLRGVMWLCSCGCCKTAPLKDEVEMNRRCCRMAANAQKPKPEKTNDVQKREVDEVLVWQTPNGECFHWDQQCPTLTKTIVRKVVSRRECRYCLDKNPFAQEEKHEKKEN